MTANAFCSSCGTQLAPGAAYCGRCGAPAAGQAATPSQPGLQQNVAGGLLELEKLRAKLIPFRVAGLVLGLVVWFLLGGVLGTENVLITIILLPVLAFGGVYLGNITGLSMLRR